MRFFVQYQDDINIGCNPDGYPTNDYIERYMTSEQRVHHLRLTFSVGILTHIPTQTSHRGWVLQILAVSISHGQRIASSTSAERHSRRTPLPVCTIWAFPNVCIRTDLPVKSSTRPLRPQPTGTAAIRLMLLIYSISSLTSQCAFTMAPYIHFRTPSVITTP